ncbi:hypothetical protein N0B51_08010 [Tsuneonella sp. YG55]|uniref:Uncharacterized protein n=1 Tax=Tsuneonella litorea TaxID=2976475 RepID=A0A9X2W171_9SPHN|nr:hypothetical protein [Tsuneonella litorea]MCT2558921.1 hypothetical protein [Tsuneonella litorea]
MPPPGTGDSRLIEIKAKTATGLGIVALAAGMALAAAWAVRAGAMPDWSAPPGVRGADWKGPGAERPYPLRLALPPPVGTDAPPQEARNLSEAAGKPQGPQMPGQPEAVEPARAVPITGTSARVASRSEPQRIPGGFDIRDFGTGGASDGSNLVMTTKPVILGGSRLGAIELAVGRGASVSLDRRALSALLADRAPELSAALDRETSDRVTLDALRTRDVAIRYDPLRDALVIETRS